MAQISWITRHLGHPIDQVTDWIFGRYMRMRNGESQPHIVSLDAVLFLFLVGAYISLDFILEIPKLIPHDRAQTSILLLLVIVYWFVELAMRGKDAKWLLFAKSSLATVALLILVVIPTLIAVIGRQLTTPHVFAHDGLIQSEAATDYFLQGKNPYVEDYVDTPMADWPYREGDLTENPTLYNYLYLPLTFILAAPFQVIGTSLWGWFDHRFIYLPLFILFLIVSGSLTSDPVKRVSLILLLGLNPVLVPFIIEGRNDVVSLFLLSVTVLLLRKDKRYISAFVLALGCLTKQYLWLFIPFFFIYLGGEGGLRARLGRARGAAIVFGLTVGLLVVPWLIWDAPAFLGDIFSYQSQSVSWVYPVSGFGVGALLLAFGVIPSNTASFPFWILQMTIGGTALILIIRRILNNINIRHVLIGYGLFVFVILYTARAFNDNYLGYISSVIILGAFIDDF